VVSLITEHPAVVPILILTKPCVVKNPTVEPVPTTKPLQRLLSLYLWELSKSVNGLEVLKRPNASVAIGGNVTDAAADDVEIDTVPVTGRGLLELTGALLRLSDTCPVVPIPTVP
jgi:hypothetical protein